MTTPDSTPIAGIDTPWTASDEAVLQRAFTDPHGDHGNCCGIPLAAYVAGARRDLAGMAFTPGHDTNIVHHLLLEIDRLRDGLDFYADEANWASRVLYTVPDGEPNAGAQACETGPAWDRGEHARTVLGGRAEVTGGDRDA